MLTSGKSIRKKRKRRNVCDGFKFLEISQKQKKNQKIHGKSIKTQNVFYSSMCFTWKIHRKNIKTHVLYRSMCFRLSRNLVEKYENAEGSGANTIKNKTRFQSVGDTFEYGESESGVGLVRNRCSCSGTAKT